MSYISKYALIVKFWPDNYTDVQRDSSPHNPYTTMFVDYLE